MAKAKTSITEKAAQAVAEAEPVAKKKCAMKFCARISGLHIRALAKPGIAAWRYRYTDDSGKRRVFTLGKYPAMSPAKAADLALDFQQNETDPFKERDQKRDAERRAEQQAATRTLAAYLDGPYKRHQERKKSGDETLARIERGFPELLDKDMASLRRADIQTWQNRREAEGRAHATLQRDFGALKTLLRHAERQDPPVIDANPLAKVQLEAPVDNDRARELTAKRNAARRLLTDAEVQGLYSGLESFAEQRRAQRRNSREHGKSHLPDLEGVTCAHWFVPFAYCALYTGLRPGDLYSLTWQELNVPFARLVKMPEKTRHHPDPAQVTMTLAEPLKKIMAEWWELAGKPADGLVFPSPAAKTLGKQMDKKAHRSPWSAVKEFGKLPDDLAFYSLRHHFISALVAGGVPLFTVARLAGHKSVAMIEKNYGHLCPDAAADAMAVFERSLPGTPEVNTA